MGVVPDYIGPLIYLNPLQVFSITFPVPQQNYSKLFNNRLTSFLKAF